MEAIARLKAVLGLDAKAYKAGMGDASRSTQKFQQQLKTVGRAIGVTFSAAAVVAFSRSIVRWATDVSIAARNAGVLTSEMIALNRVAIQTGLGVNDMQRLLSRMQTELYNAAKGSGESARKFEDLGLSVRDLAGMDPAAMFQAVAKAAFDSGRPLTALADLFGDRLGPNAVAALRQIAEGELPAVDNAVGQTADMIEAMGSKWSVMGDRVKEWGVITVGWIDKAHSAMVGFVADASVKWWENIKTGAGAAAELTMRGISTIRENGAVEGLKAIAASGDARASMKTIVDSAAGNMGLGSQSVLQAGFEGSFDTLKEREKSVNDAISKREDEANRAKKEMLQILDDTEKANLQKRIDELQKPILAEMAAMEKAGSKGASISGQGVRTDAIASVGGMIGGQRAGVAVVDRQMKIQAESLAVQRKIADLTQRLVDAEEQARINL